MILVEHHAMKNVKIAVKLIVMILANQQMHLLVQIIYQQVQQKDVDKIVLLDVIFIAQDVLAIVLD